MSERTLVIIKDCMQGYCWMHQRCLLVGYGVSTKKVTRLPSILDLEGVESRKTEKSSRKGYYANICNYLWHIDLYNMTN